ncbi:UDP-N-acetylmuramoyl-L-alanyl-D-glutamate--2,6-diaminopimelate ligase [Amphritea balenae]|uniref:UDP-N-acetylmuramoyl-L-alanyl-D-glutamate--2,6-diaminopimelate ligase n=1 Tax=Amphritea balenae TaxID=452629 RepID=A0A3P1SSG7_9GAMM|nr:UDP-N-acetylmuramoyl-L-alanyl-D-glutamate--2,6-diaminopimelate ligase [Amphritea balenae]RRD00132.1 UDP-N-acetylmuramoyl-L-alanyl-D-glutamate--2,6-diaminopimelate ligase [Amphritea balenae]GGK76931.1 UDP-N-acetylmuramoyl-L-alanyl-D-glutamate--2,6-diaminopimelate ligase [Amphritea balenae]
MSMKRFSLAELMPQLADTAVAGLIVKGVAQDSRAVQPGDLFFARDGVSHKGIDFVCSAAAEGAVAAIVNDAELAAADPIDVAIPLIGVADVAELIGEVASRFYGEPSLHMKVVGITGTNGKTSCAHYIAQVLDYSGETSALIGTVGNGLLGQLDEASHTTPDAISLHAMLAALLQQGATSVVMEVSSHALDQHRVSGVHFDAAGFTNLSRDHLDYHGDMETYGAAKARLFNEMNIDHQVVNADDSYGVRILAQSDGQDRISFGEVAGAQVRATKVQLSTAGINAEVSTPWGTFQMDTGLIGRFNLSNLLLTIAVTGKMGLPLSQIAEAVNAISAVPGRMQLVSRDQPLVAVDYAHTPDALEKALEALRNHCQGNLWCVFGCGGDRDNGKRPQMAAIAERLADKVVVTSDNPRTEDPDQIISMVLAGFKESEPEITDVDRAQAITAAVNALQEQDILLIAGKGHENYQDIQGVKMPFDDVAVAEAAMTAKRDTGAQL